MRCSLINASRSLAFGAEPLPTLFRASFIASSCMAWVASSEMGAYCWRTEKRSVKAEVSSPEAVCCAEAAPCAPCTRIWYCAISRTVRPCSPEMPILCSRLLVLSALADEPKPPAEESWDCICAA